MSKKDFQDIRDFGEGLKAFGEIVSETANYFEAISEVAKDIIPSNN